MSSRVMTTMAIMAAMTTGGWSATPTTQGPPLSVVVVEWKIKKGMDSDFLKYWETTTVIPDRSGLVGEFLSKEGDAAVRFPWIRWPDRSTPEYTVYYNVGLWRSETDFANQIGKYIDVGRQTLPFEYDHRQRLLVDPVAWRRGPVPLPTGDAEGVE